MSKVNRESPGASYGYSATSLWFDSLKIEILTLPLVIVLYISNVFVF